MAAGRGGREGNPEAEAPWRGEGEGDLRRSLGKATSALTQLGSPCASRCPFSPGSSPGSSLLLSVSLPLFMRAVILNLTWCSGFLHVSSRLLSVPAPLSSGRLTGYGSRVRRLQVGRRGPCSALSPRFRPEMLGPDTSALAFLGHPQMPPIVEDVRQPGTLRPRGRSGACSGKDAGSEGRRPGLAAARRAGGASSGSLCGLIGLKRS